MTTHLTHPGSPDVPALDLHARFTAARPAVAERLAAGKALRQHLPRRQHGVLPLPDTREDPVANLEAQARTRLSELVPVCYARMLTSPFAFLRGAAAVMAQDLTPTATTGLTVQACGDMHVANFGIFASAERHLIFGINDFDETQPGPWEWDLKRLAASAAVASRFFGADRVGCEEAARACVQAYRSHMRQYAQMGHLALWYTCIDEPALLAALPPALRKRARQITAKARQRTHLQVLDKLTDLVDNQQQIVEEHPFIVRETHTRTGRTMAEALDLFLQDYLATVAPDRRQLLARYQIVDVARKVVGVGSVGTRCWVIFLRGLDDDDPLFLQVKEAQASVLAPYVDPAPYTNHGQRVVVGQRLIQGAPDIFLGWVEQDGLHYYVRQLRDMKGGLEFDPSKVRVANFPAYCGLCGWALALAHAKSGDAALIAGYVGTNAALDESIARFALAYADQTEQDHATLTRAARAGCIQVAQAE